jgi:hypothetical protein
VITAGFDPAVVLFITTISVQSSSHVVAITASSVFGPAVIM